MLQIDKVQEIEGVTVFGDSDKISVFYPLAQQPRYRRGPDGRLSFAFYKYRFPVDRPDGKKGGGFLLFDVEFVVEDEVLVKVKQKLAEQVAAEANRLGIQPVPEVVIGAFTYTKGTTSLLYPQGLVEREVPSGGTPSLFGNNISTFALELPPEGATFFEQAMQGQGGAVAIAYELWFWAQLPAINVNGYFNASKFYTFYQTIDTDWNLWSEDSYRETVREQTINSESMHIDFEWGGVTDEKIRGPIRDWAYRTLEKSIERNMIDAIAPVPDDQRKLPDGIEDVTRDISNTKITNIYINYKESQTVEWRVAPRGVLPNITNLKDGNGAPVKWSDYARVIDLDDPFFKTLRINTFVNADFKGLPIHSVEVKLIYKGRPMANLAEGEPDGEVVMNKEEDVGKFAAYVEGDDWKYTYSYQVNYRGESRQYQSPEIETNEGNLTIGVDDVGVLSIEATAGDINWTELDRAAVVLTYEDDAGGVEELEEQFNLTQAAPTFKIQRVIFQPMRNNYKYRIKYFMKDGREYQGAERQGRSQRLFINDVFDARKTVSVRGVGDFANRIQTVFVDLEYTDAAHTYTQTKSQALTAASPFFDWTFPVIDEKAGKVTYKAMIAYKDGTTDTVPVTDAASGTIVLPPPAEAFLEVQIIADLINWEQVKLARVSLNYDDLASDVSQAKDFVFSASNKANTTWKVEVKNKEQDDYTYAVSYYLATGQKKDVPPTSTSELALILDPAA
ncbi:hypothetical protein NKH84_14340 [Mesorhizobium sp. M0902]|uniref:hypothetical protein n=1 Tax=Mesorhizobium sp. M0902 TaxID=2957021 RepID=UPI003338DDD9